MPKRKHVYTNAELRAALKAELQFDLTERKHSLAIKDYGDAIYCNGAVDTIERLSNRLHIKMKKKR
jgi:hypothetical protein